MVKPFRISLSDVGKKYRRWVIKNVSLELDSPYRYGITGRNGAGKSTLLRIISGYTSPTLGTVTYFHGDDHMDDSTAAKIVSYAAPYIDTVEELTVSELYTFHSKFQSFRSPVKDLDSFLNNVQLNGHRDAYVGDLSSGLMQRLKIGLAVLTDTPVLLLDEPTSYLDNQGKVWFQNVLENHASERLVIIASNDQFDIGNCQKIIDIHAFIPEVLTEDHTR